MSVILFVLLAIIEDETFNRSLELFRQWTKEQNKGKNRSLLRAVAKTFWKEYLFLGFLCLINDVIIRIVQPQLLRQFLLYFKWVCWAKAFLSGIHTKRCYSSAHVFGIFTDWIPILAIWMQYI